MNTHVYNFVKDTVYLTGSHSSMHRWNKGALVPFPAIVLNSICLPWCIMFLSYTENLVWESNMIINYTKCKSCVQDIVSYWRAFLSQCCTEVKNELLLVPSSQLWFQDKQSAYSSWLSFCSRRSVFSPCKMDFVCPRSNWLHCQNNDWGQHPPSAWNLLRRFSLKTHTILTSAPPFVAVLQQAGTIRLKGGFKATLRGVGRNKSVNHSGQCNLW